MTSEVFLENTKEGISLLASEVLHLLADDIGFILVVGNG